MKNLNLTLGLFLILVLGLFSSCSTDLFDIEGPFESNKPEPLNFFEDAMVGKFSYYHRYDGSTKYYIFNSDRTACFWSEIGSSRKNQKSYGHWELVDIGSNKFRIMFKTNASSTNDAAFLGEYNYSYDLIYNGGYTNLKYRRSNTSKECE